MKKYFIIFAALLVAALVVYAVTPQILVWGPNTDKSDGTQSGTNYVCHSILKSNISKIDYTTPDHQIMRATDGTSIPTDTWRFADVDEGTAGVAHALDNVMGTRSGSEGSYTYNAYIDSIWTVPNIYLLWRGSFNTTTSWHHIWFPAGSEIVNQLYAQKDVFTYPIIRLKYTSSQAGAAVQISDQVTPKTLFSDNANCFGEAIHTPSTGEYVISESNSEYELKLTPTALADLNTNGISITGDNRTQGALTVADETVSNQTDGFTLTAFGMANNILWGSYESDIDVNSASSDWTNAAVGTSTSDPLNLKDLRVGDVLTFHFKVVTAGAQWQLLKNASDQTQIFDFLGSAFTQGNYQYKDQTTATYTVTGTVTQSDIDAIAANGYTFAGHGLILKFISLNRANTETNPSVAAPKVYLIGTAISGNSAWATNQGVALSQTASGIFGGNITITSTDNTFAIMTALSSSATDWSSENRRGASAGDNTVITINGDAKSVTSSSSTNAFKASEAGNFYCEYNENTNTITLTRPNIYLIGNTISGNTNWATNEGVALPRISGNTYGGNITITSTGTVGVMKQLSSSATDWSSSYRLGPSADNTALTINGNAVSLSNNTYSCALSETGSAYCTVDLTAGTIRLTAPKKMYVIGNITHTNNLTATDYITLTETGIGTGIYSGTGTIVDNNYSENYGYINISSGKDTWDAINATDCQYGPAAANTVIANNASASMTLNNHDAWKIHEGSYTFTVNTNDNTVAIAGTETNPTTARTIYAIGNVGEATSWSATNGTALTETAANSKIFSGSVTINNDATNSDAEFAIASYLGTDWGTFGSDGTNKETYRPATSGTTVTVGDATGAQALLNSSYVNNYFVASAAGTYTMTVNLNTGYVTLASNAAESSSITWSGSASIGSWGSSLRLYGDKVTLGTTQTGTLTGSISNYTFAEGDVIAITTDGSGVVQLGYGTGNTARDSDPYASSFTGNWSVSAGTNTYILSASQATILNGLDAANRAICFNSGSSAFNITGIHIYHTTTTSLFSGTSDLGSWANPLQITTSYTYQAGDVITVTTSSHNQIQLVGNSSASKEVVSGTSDRVLSCSFYNGNDYINMSAATQTFTLSSADAELLNTSGNYLWVEGSGTVVTSVTVTR
jgi:hypothetical protein